MSKIIEAIEKFVVTVPFSNSNTEVVSPGQFIYWSIDKEKDQIKLVVAGRTAIKMANKMPELSLVHEGNSINYYVVDFNLLQPEQKVKPQESDFNNYDHLTDPDAKNLTYQEIIAKYDASDVVELTKEQRDSLDTYWYRFGEYYEPQLDFGVYVEELVGPIEERPIELLNQTFYDDTLKKHCRVTNVLNSKYSTVLDLISGEELTYDNQDVYRLTSLSII